MTVKGRRGNEETLQFSLWRNDEDLSAGTLPEFMLIKVAQLATHWKGCKRSIISHNWPLWNSQTNSKSVINIVGVDQPHPPPDRVWRGGVWKTGTCVRSHTVAFLPSTLRFSAKPLFRISAINSEGCIDGPVRTNHSFNSLIDSCPLPPLRPQQGAWWGLYSCRRGTNRLARFSG